MFLGSDFHMPELCNQTNICGSPPAPQSRHGSLQRNVPAYQSPCWPQTALQLTLAIRNSAFPPGNPQCHLHPLFLGRCCSHPTPPCPGLHWGASWGGGAGCRHWLGAPWTQWGGRGGRAALPLVHVTSQSAGGPGWGGGGGHSLTHAHCLRRLQLCKPGNSGTCRPDLGPQGGPQRDAFLNASVSPSAPPCASVWPSAREMPHHAF